MQTAWTKSAWKELLELPKSKRAAVIDAVSRFAADPYGSWPNAKALVGERNAVRLRVGEYRVILRRGGGAIEVRAVAHRREVYR